MSLIRVGGFLGLLAGCALLSLADDLGADQLALLQDSGGWEYISMNDSQDGFPTQHTCFDGQPHPETCSGTLTLSPNHNFVQKVFIHHQTVARHGTYQLDGDQLAFFDEFGTRDGPYTIAIDTQKKFMTMDMPQVNVKLELHKQYRRRLDAKQKNAK